MQLIIVPYFVFLSALLFFAASSQGSELRYNDIRRLSGKDWLTYGGDPAQTHYSMLDQINTTNVNKLRVVWEYHTEDSNSLFAQIQCNPVVVDGVLYITTAKLRVIALNGATGKPIWSFNPFAKGESAQGVNRGVTYWEGEIDRRIFVSAGPYLYALNANTGLPVMSFGDNGRVDLRNGLGRDPKQLSVDATSPGIIFEDIIIMGSRVGEGPGSSPGHVRAYDIRTGAQRWIFHTIPQPGEFGYETWPPDAWKNAGGANAWAGMSVDERRGLVFVPTGSATYDFYGADRIGDNLFANSILALDVRTGKRVWHFQTVHHDLWDRDLAAPPNLVTLKRNGKYIDAVAQVTKQGYVFIFDRETGIPLFEIEERHVPNSDVDGESASLTQPIPKKPPPFTRQIISEDQLTNLSYDSHTDILRRFKNLRSNGPFTPPSRNGSILIPGLNGGAGWGGAAYDPETGVLYVNASDIPYILKLIRLEGSIVSVGRAVYLRNCSNCHGANQEGDGMNIPSLINLREKYSLPKAFELVMGGRGRMPGFPQIAFAEMMSLLTYLLEGIEVPNTKSRDGQSIESSSKNEYVLDGFEQFLDPEGRPAIQPPWGTLSAIDLTRGKIRWQIPLGEYPELVAKGLRNTGAESYGGPILTAGGLLFIAATPDEKFRAYDKRTNELLWEVKLPAAGFATPSTYSINGKQYIVIAAGGGKLGRPTGDSYVAFALPNKNDESSSRMSDQ